MSKNEDIILEEKINENELPKSKNYKKIKHLTVIIAFTLIIAAVITLSIAHFKVETIEKGNKPVVRNLGFDITAAKTFNLGSFKVHGQTVSIKYVVSVTKAKCTNKIVISSSLGHAEFGNTGVAAPGSGTKSYNMAIFKFNLPQLPTVSVTGYAKGSLSWSVAQKAAGKLSIGLSGTLTLAAEMKNASGAISSFSCNGQGTLTEAKGKLVASNGSITKDTDFSLGMGHLKITYSAKIGTIDIKLTTINLFEGWRSV
jgi:hypothetical protein